MKKCGITALFVAAAVSLLPRVVDAGGSHNSVSISGDAYAENKVPSQALYSGPHCTVNPNVTFSSIAVDGKTGRVLYDDNAEHTQHPASLTKMMVVYEVFKALKSGRLKLTDSLPISKNAASQQATNLGLRAGDTITVENALWGATVQSANDAVMVFAEALGGTGGNFAQEMTRQAHALGMTNTEYVNPSGLPNKDQLTSASDLIKIMQALRRDFPQLFSAYFGRPTFTYPRYENNTYKNATYHNYNPLLGWDGVVDGKSGFTCDAGHNLAVLAIRGDKQVLAVIVGEHTPAKLKQDMMGLLNKSFKAAGRDNMLSSIAPPSGAVQKPSVMQPLIQPRG